MPGELSGTPLPDDPVIAPREPGGDRGGDSERGPAAGDVPQKGVAVADQRAAPRHMLVLRSAKLIVEGAEYLCILRDVSETGASIRIFHPLPAAASMVLELQNEDRHAVEMVWNEGEKAGLRFLHRADVARLIEMPSGYPRRGIRIRVNRPGVISWDAGEAECMILDIGQHGAKLASAQPVAIHQHMRLSAPGLPTVDGKICWRRGEKAGLAFETIFQLSELACTAAAMQARDG